MVVRLGWVAGRRELGGGRAGGPDAADDHADRRAAEGAAEHDPDRRAPMGATVELTQTHAVVMPGARPPATRLRTEAAAARGARRPVSGAAARGPRWSRCRAP